MKYLKFGLMAALLVMFTGNLVAQSCSGSKAKSACCAAKAKASASVEEASPLDAILTTATFKVLGNCGMCKRTIEGAAAEVEGVYTATWDMDAKIMTVRYNPDTTTSQQVQEKIAATGYDTEQVRATDEAYSALHGCCQYQRTRL